MKDLVTEKGAAAFGTRLRRLSERMDRDVRELYRRHAHDFEPGWFPVFVALAEEGPMSVGDLAQRMRISHAAVSQIRGKLSKAHLISVRADAADQRRQLLQLTARGHALAKRLAPLWSAIAKATDDICRKHAPHLLQQLEALEAALDERSLLERVAPGRARSLSKEKVHAA
jgi:DNA-binding MarR family transcriptional regulator